MAEMSHPEATAEGSTQANAPKDSRPLYEIGFHVVPNLEEGKVSEVVEDLRRELSAIKAEIVGEQTPQKMTLAYVIERSVLGKREKFGEAYFGWIRFVVEERSGIPEIESYLRHKREILRFLLIETKREEQIAPRRAVFSSKRLEGETIKKPAAAPEAGGTVSDEELDKSLEALVQ
ncbi:MAG TPA: 30S ribosomal protein S6 [Candidatus Paceibacterota bacterium]|nr:30S ribosomal protein S6 [Candidatus Paceibacterota bacterium]